jgi:hypothetical protein
MSQLTARIRKPVSFLQIVGGILCNAKVVSEVFMPQTKTRRGAQYTKREEPTQAQARTALTSKDEQFSGTSLAMSLRKLSLWKTGI